MADVVFLSRITGFQTSSANLTTFAGITPSANVQSILNSANYAAIKALLDLEAGTDFYSISAADAAFQPLDADLTTWASITPGSGVGTFLATPSSANLAAAVTGETGSGALVFGTSPGFTTAANPVSDDGATLGTSALKWSDLFLATGAVITFNSGNATITHSASLLTSNVNIAVPDEAYGTSWDGSVNVPTKNAIYDQLQGVSYMHLVLAGGFE